MAYGSNGKLSAKVLILNQNYEPMSVFNVKKAIILLYLGKAELIEAHDGNRVHSVSMTHAVPEHRPPLRVRPGSLQEDHPVAQEHPPQGRPPLPVLRPGGRRR